MQKNHKIATITFITLKYIKKINIEIISYVYWITYNDFSCYSYETKRNGKLIVVI